MTAETSGLGSNTTGRATAVAIPNIQTNNGLSEKITVIFKHWA